jgi:hypothetical protein
MTITPIHAADVSITVATVSIQTIQINHKQMTLSVFKQLPYRGLPHGGDALDDGDVIWGWVNHHTKHCLGYHSLHLHVIWQWHYDEWLYVADVEPADRGAYDRLRHEYPQLFIAV